MKTNQFSTRYLRILGVILLLGLTALACTMGEEGTDQGGDAGFENTRVALESTQKALDIQSTEKALQRTLDAQAVQPTETPLPPTNTPVEPTNTPIEPTATKEPAAAEDETATLVIENTSSITVCYLFVSLTTDTEWGSDQLEDDVIMAGDTYELWGIPAGRYDLKVSDCDGDELAVQQGIYFAERDEITWTLEDDIASGPAATQAIPVNYCVDSSGGRTKVRVENHTEEVATLYLYGPENYVCTIDPGVQRIYIKGGNYSASAIMCGGQTVSYGTNTINSTWYLTLYCP